GRSRASSRLDLATSPRMGESSPSRYARCMRTSSAPISTRAVLVSCAFAFASPAQAWESECRVGDIRDREIRHSICRASEFQTCAEGVAAPRGTQWGEHALIAELALIRAGLSDVALRRDALPPYY